MVDHPLRRINPDLHHLAVLRALAERMLRVGVVIGAVVGWILIAHAVRAQLAAGG